MEELVELLLAAMVERPIVGIAVLTFLLSFTCFTLTGSVVPIVFGFLISLCVHWRISRCRVTTLGLSDGTAPTRRHSTPSA